MPRTHTTQHKKKSSNPIKKWAEDPNRHFPKENTQMANRHVKRCSISLIVRDVHMKSMMWHHLTALRMAVAKKTTGKKCWSGCGEKDTLVHCWWECELMQIPWKIALEISKTELKIELTLDLVIPLLGIYLKKTKTLIHKDVCTLLSTAALFTTAKVWKQSKCSLIDEWIKEDVEYVYSGILPSHNKE